MAQITLLPRRWINALMDLDDGKNAMKSNEIRPARTALMEKSILVYRKAGAGSERTSGAKVGNTKSPMEKVSDAKVGSIKARGPARLEKVSDAKVGIPKIRA